MRVSIQVSGGESTIYGRADFINAVVNAIDAYEQATERTTQTMTTQEVKAIVRKPRRKTRYQVWTEEQLVELKNYLKAEKLGLITGRVGVSRLAKKFNRTNQSVSSKLWELRKGE